MQAVIDSIENKVTEIEMFYGISWENYEQLLDKYREMPIPRLTYDSGILEVINSNSFQHELNNRTLCLLLDLISSEMSIDFRPLGSMTIKRRTIRKGFEPDSCYYIQSLDLIE